MADSSTPDSPAPLDALGRAIAHLEEAVRLAPTGFSGPGDIRLRWDDAALLARSLRSSTERVDERPHFFEQSDMAHALHNAERVAPGEQRIEGWAYKYIEAGDWAFSEYQKNAASKAASLLIHNAGASVPEPAEEGAASFGPSDAQRIREEGRCYDKVGCIWAVPVPAGTSVMTREGDVPQVLKMAGHIATDGHSCWPIAADFMAEHYRERAGADVEGPSEPITALADKVESWAKAGTGLIDGYEVASEIRKLAAPATPAQTGREPDEPVYEATAHQIRSYARDLFEQDGSTWDEFEEVVASMLRQAFPSRAPATQDAPSEPDGRGDSQEAAKP